MVELPLLVSVIGVSISAGLLWIGLQRYKREVPQKSLSYSVSANGNAVRIRVWNSGNTAIEPEDYISSVGFSFGTETPVHEVYVEDQEPEDLGAEAKSLDTGRIEVPPIYLNPKDSFTLRVPLTAHHVPGSHIAAGSALRPYGRIRGVHRLFKEADDEPSTIRLVQRLFEKLLSERRTAHRDPTETYDTGASTAPAAPTWLKLIQVLGPATLALIGTIISALSAR